MNNTTTYNVEYVINTSIEIQIDATSLKQAKAMAKERLKDELAYLNESDAKIIVTED